MFSLTAAQMKRAENLASASGISHERLMENAGNGGYEYLAQAYPDVKRVLLLAGNGNNAGDGFVTARRYAEQGARVTVCLCEGGTLSELAALNFERLTEYEAAIIDFENIDAVLSEVNSADMIIDAVFGTGFHGSLPIDVARLFAAVNSKKRLVVALDMPSGIDSTDGTISENTIRASLTMAYGAPKTAHSQRTVQEFCGKLCLIDIGIREDILRDAITAPALITTEMVEDILPVRPTDAHKGLYGRLLNLSGSFSMSGAAMLSTLAAMRIGAGIVRLGTPVSVANMVTSALMEAMVVPLPESRMGSLSAVGLESIRSLMEKSTAVMIGCGLAQNADTKQIVEFVINNTIGNIVIDADGLNCLVGRTELLKKLGHRAVITPHIGEMARLVGKSIEYVLAHSAETAYEFARDYGVVVVLKNYRTIIATEHGELYYNQTGNPGLAKGGSGDILAGMIGGLTAQGFPPFEASLCAVYLHGAAADSLSERMSQYSMLGRDIIDEIPIVLKRLGR